MEGHATMLQGQVYGQEGAGAVLGPIGTQREPEKCETVASKEDESRSEKECEESSGHSAQDTASSGQMGLQGSSGPAQAHAPSQGQPGSGQAASQGPGGPSNCSQTGGCEEYSQGPIGWNPGPSPQQMGHVPGAEPQYGPYVHSQGFSGMPYGMGQYAPPYHPGQYPGHEFGPPIGGPQPWMHAGPGRGPHPGCQAHYQGMYGPPSPEPHFGAGMGAGLGYAGPPHSSAHGEQNFGQFADMFGKALQGQATPQDLVSGLLNLNFHDDQFWKGVVVGSVVALLMNSDAVRQTLTGALGGIFGKSGPQAQTHEQAGDQPS